MESMSAFIVRLKDLATHCDFNNFLQEALQDRLVSGLHSRFSKRQTQLLAIPDLTFEKAKSKCIADEMAHIATDEHQNSASSSTTTHRLTHQGHHHSYYQTRQSKNKSSQPCKCCGGNDHRHEDCKFRNAISHSCGKRAHSASMPFEGEESTYHGSRRGGHGRSNPNSTSSHTRYLEEISDNEVHRNSVNDQALEQISTSVDSVRTDEDSYSFWLFNISGDTESVSRKPYLITLSIGEKQMPVSMELDTGASHSTISESVYRAHLSQSYPLKNCNLTLRGYSDKTFIPYAVVMASLQDSGFQERLSELVLSGNELQAPVRARLKKLLLHSNLTWDDVESHIQCLMTQDCSRQEPFPWSKVLSKLKSKKKKSKKHVHGRMTYTVAELPSRMITPQKCVTSAPGRRHSRPIGSCWAGKGACLQDFYSNNPETRSKDSR